MASGIPTKTDKEIIDWIDSKEVLTQNELMRFMYNSTHNGGGMPGSGRWRKFWQYVLETKDWVKLREYRDAKMKVDWYSNNHNYQLFKKAYGNDPRFKGIGKRKAKRLFEDIYKIKLSISTIGRYIKQIRGNNA
jgi:hypothetical protein